MDPRLKKAIETVHAPGDWVHFATIGRDGGPHVTPLMMGIKDPYLLFSLTGKQKVLNIERDPRACVAISRPVTMAHVIVWGTMQLRWDEEAQAIWEEMITNAFGPEGLAKRARRLSREATMLGLLTPKHHRIYGID
jgi:general stress protein 26